MSTTTCPVFRPTPEEFASYSQANFSQDKQQQSIKKREQYEIELNNALREPRNAKKENSIVLEVRKNIAIHKESLDVWKEKLKQLRNIG